MGVFHGQGTCRLNHSWIGEWVDGKQNGVGTFTAQYCSGIKGVWKDGKRVHYFVKDENTYDEYTEEIDQSSVLPDYDIK